MIRYLRVTFYALLIMSLGVGISGCSKENQRKNPPQEQGEDVGISGEDAEVNTDADSPPPKDAETDPVSDADQPDTETDIGETAQAPPQAGQQLCAVAGKSSNGDVIALHCLGAHDASGFQAKNDSGVWQPGALQIITK